MFQQSWQGKRSVMSEQDSRKQFLNGGGGTSVRKIIKLPMLES